MAVMHANRVVACSSSARAVGVRRGMRKRQTQATCPEIELAAADDHRDGRLFEPVITALADAVPAVEILRPGLVVSAVGRTVVSEAELAEHLIDVVATCGVEAQVGMADEMFTAVLAARRGQVVECGGSTAYLAPLRIAELAAEPAFADAERADLVELLRRLGITTIGAFAALQARDVGSRFGADAVVAHRLARAEPGRPPAGAALPEDLVIEHLCDPPVDRVDAAAFLGRRLAEALHTRLSASSVACTRLTVEAITERGQRHARTWRCAAPLTPEATADRIRWQLEGWLTGGRGARAARPDSPVMTLRLEPVEVIDSGALQYGISGPGLPETDECGERARRALIRVQGLLGGDAVKVPVLGGGRGPREQVTLVTLGEERIPARTPDAPWPGRLPQPTPAVMSETAVAVLDADGEPVTVSARGAFSAEPTTIRLDPSAAPRRKDSWAVEWWAGPWPSGWDGSAVSARAQVLLEDTRALLVHYRGGNWVVEGVYE